MKDKTKIEVYTDPTHFMLMSAKSIVIRSPEKYGFQSADDVTWDFIINYALQKTFGKDSNGQNTTT